MQVQGSALEKSVCISSMVIGRKAEYRHCSVGSCGEQGTCRNSHTGTSVFPVT